MSEAAVVVLDGADSVAVATRPLAAGERLPGAVEVREAIPAGHKVALTAIASGAPVIKYGETIGTACADIGPGCHVHVHNLISARVPGREPR